jgi:ubiquinone/menaquinone biosynthesis C-methylase UbiE
VAAGSCSPGWRHPTGWLSYDGVAETYDRVAVPWFRPMAGDLVAAVAIPPGASVLDLGTGTGLVAELAQAAAGRRGLVVGVDPSTGMLRLARTRRRIVAIAGMVPGLAFRDGTFDAVVANLVLSHLPDLADGVADMVRVLRPGGRLGVTAWGPTVPAHEDNQEPEADRVVAAVRDQCGLASQAPVQGAPFEEALRNRERLCGALRAAALVVVEAQLHTYRRTCAIDDYLSGWGGLGRYLRQEAGEQRWQDFCQRAADALRNKFGASILSAKQAWVATGTAP